MISQHWISEEYILVKTVALFVLRRGLLLRSDVENKVDKLDPQMGILNLSVEHDGNAASKLHVEVNILANI
jgi:hypothetical protein